MQTAPTTRISLAEIKAGEHATFLSISAEKAVASRLTSLGFTPGAAIEMTQNYGRGPLVVTIRGTRIALGREEAKNMSVEKGKSS